MTYIDERIWHRKRITVYRSGIEVNRSHVRWDQVKGVYHNMAEEATWLGPLQHPDKVLAGLHGRGQVGRREAPRLQAEEEGLPEVPDRGRGGAGRGGREEGEGRMKISVVNMVVRMKLPGRADLIKLTGAVPNSSYEPQELPGGRREGLRARWRKGLLPRLPLTSSPPEGRGPPQGGSQVCCLPPSSSSTHSWWRLPTLPRSSSGRPRAGPSATATLARRAPCLVLYLKAKAPPKIPGPLSVNAYHRIAHLLNLHLLN
jgi:hypothetical protein